MKNALEIRKLFFRYDQQYIIKGINLEVKMGDFTALIGSNGSGKSTLMKLMIGNLKPGSGTVQLLGTPIEKFRDWGRVGYISQGVKNFNQSFPATVREIIAANLYQQMGLFKVFKPEFEEKIDKALDLVDMKRFKDKQIGGLSGGQQQRIFIARIMVTAPDLIFLDEPLVGVDSRTQDDFFQLINKLNDEMGISIVMISHDIHVISSRANRIICFDQGQIYEHPGDEFDYACYLDDTKGKNRLIPEHSHQEGD